MGSSTSQVVSKLLRRDFAALLFCFCFCLLSLLFCTRSLDVTVHSIVYSPTVTVLVHTRIRYIVYSNMRCIIVQFPVFFFYSSSDCTVISQVSLPLFVASLFSSFILVKLLTCMKSVLDEMYSIDCILVHWTNIKCIQIYSTWTHWNSLSLLSNLFEICIKYIHWTRILNYIVHIKLVHWTTMKRIHWTWDVIYTLPLSLYFEQ